MNSQAERLKSKCPGCAHWGKGHIINIVTTKEVCTVKLVNDSGLNEHAAKMQETDESRVASWRDCSVAFCERQKPKLLKRLFGKRKPKRYCPMCGSRIGRNEFSAFCSMECAMKFMDKEEKDGAFQDRG